MADRFPFMRVYREMAEQLEKDDRADFYDALIDYALDGKEPQPSTGAAVFYAAKRIVDKWKQTSAAGKARADKSAGRSVDGRWTSAGSENPAKEEKKKSIKDNKNNSERVTQKRQAADVRPQEVVDLYHSICVDLPHVRDLTKERIRHIKARLKDKKNDLDAFREVFERAEASDFLTGKVKSFKADFDWIVGSPSNWTHILEGRYDNRPDPTNMDRAEAVAEALIGSASPEAAADFENSMNGGYRI